MKQKNLASIVIGSLIIIGIFLVFFISRNKTTHTLDETNNIVSQDQDNPALPQNIPDANGVTPSTPTVASPCTTTSDLRYCNEIFNVSDINVQTVTVATAPSLSGSGLVSVLADVYQPKTDTVTERPVVIFGHAGGGDKADSQPASWCQKFVMRGWVCASINYRTIVGGFDPTVQEAAFSDVLATARWFRANKLSYKIDPNRIIAGGVSAGALAALGADIAGNNVGTASFSFATNNTSNSNEPSWICHAFSLSGALLDDFLTTLLDAKDPPVNMYNGTADMTIKYSQAQKTYSSMGALGIPSSLKSFEGATHKIGHATEIDADLFPRLYETVITQGCPAPNQSVSKI